MMPKSVKQFSDDIMVYLVDFAACMRRQVIPAWLQHALGAEPMAQLACVEASRRGNGRFWPYPFGTRRISRSSSLKSPCGGRHHGGLFACLSTKSGSRHARNLNVDWS
ncbi:hypothetical protein EET67_14810 [Pseudaminobacter arsenicus]|uniref:Uncharacterized protein n=1 Tax=Borborobacter arsenicus TaxID=1851146 RepID=A0A432V4R2_9HYPH|nr:hypothetical protein EET67_14810 [Pseudaminobacter arsenicus]